MLFYMSLKMYISGLTKTKTCALVHNHNKQSHPRPGGFKIIPCIQELSMSAPMSLTMSGKPFVWGVAWSVDRISSPTYPLCCVPLCSEQAAQPHWEEAFHTLRAFHISPLQIWLSCIIHSLGQGGGQGEGEGSSVFLAAFPISGLIGSQSKYMSPTNEVSSS
jgi:hypothetical protein